MYHLDLFLPLCDVFFLRVIVLPYCKEKQKEECHLNTNPLFIFWGRARRKTDKCLTQIYPTNNSICIQQNNSHPICSCRFFWINTVHQKIDFFLVLTENCTTKNARTLLYQKATKGKDKYGKLVLIKRFFFKIKYQLYRVWRCHRTEGAWHFGDAGHSVAPETSWLLTTASDPTHAKAEEKLCELETAFASRCGRRLYNCIEELWFINGSHS